LYEFGERKKNKVLSVAESKELYYLDRETIEREIRKLEKKMREAARELEFEKAALFRDKIFELKEILIKY